MSENFVRKTLNVKNIKAKETYTLHDLDLVETEDGHVYIRIKNKNTEFNNEGDRFAYFYEVTNNVKQVNEIPLTTDEQTTNTGNLHLPLVMDVQHLDGEIKLTMAGKIDGFYKVNGTSGTYANGVTTFSIPLEGSSIPNITVKQGNSILAMYELFQADLEQTDPLHPEFVKGASELIQRVDTVEREVQTLQDTPITYQTYQDKTQKPIEYGIITNDPNTDTLVYAFCDGNQLMTTPADQLYPITNVTTLPNGFKKIVLGSPFIGWSKIMLYRNNKSQPIVALQSYPANITIEGN